MLRSLKLIVLGILMIGIVLISLANRGAVTVHLLPEPLQPILPVSTTQPLFVVILISVLVGLLIGYILEWLREHKHRKTASERKREVSRLNREVSGLKKKHLSEEDEVLAILDQKPGNA